MSEDRTIRGVFADDPQFLRSLKRIRDPQLRTEILERIRALLLLELDKAPRKLHLHQLQARKVQSRLDRGKQVAPWTFHVTTNDAYKASFTLEGGVAYLRLVDEHDVIDKNP